MTDPATLPFDTDAILAGCGRGWSAKARPMTRLRSPG